MMLLKKTLPRRTVLRGLGATIALPLLDSMVPALASTHAAAAQPVRRFGIVYVGMGMNMNLWTPETEGTLELSQIQLPLSDFKDRLVVVSNLDSHAATTQGADGGQHPRAQTSWLTGARAKATEGLDIRAGESLDQIVAKVQGASTQLQSLELAIEDTDLLGTCSFGYSCAYNNTISWRTPTTPLPMENNPRAVFQRLFGASDSTDRAARLLHIQRDRSILDSITGKVADLERGLGPGDRRKVEAYLDAVRDVERRTQVAEEQIDRELPVVDRPMGIPAGFEEHVKLMFDLQRLAFQTDLTRVSTFLMSREASNRSYPEIGVADAYHPLSHHQNLPEKLAKQAKVNVFHLQMFAYQLEKMRDTPDGDGSLLDHTLWLYGSGMSDSNLHINDDVPTLLVGGPAFNVRGGRHVRAPQGTRLTNLQLTLLDKLGLPVEKFGDSTGKLKLVSDV